MPDDPHVSRIIRTPHSTISIKGTLDEVDRVYRISTKALLENGYGLRPSSDDPWSNYTPPPEENVDYLRRRLNTVEQQLAQSLDHEVIQALRRELAETRLERDTWRMAFTDLDETVQSALRVMAPGPGLMPLSPRECITESILKLER